tara:strand:+ start:768 stop:1490 length:723 start_codon:yes stop_codon:yes gene_type:complete
MIYALIDIGNTALKAKVYNSGSLLFSANIINNDQSLRLFFEKLKVDQYLISSVVPSMNKKIKKINSHSTIFLNHNHFSNLKIHVNPPTSVGIDRLVNAVAVSNRWDCDAIIIDIGTVVTFCRVKQGGDYYGGIIVPGFKMISRALFSGAEQLPLVHFPTEKPKLIGQSTEAAMTSGFFHGAIQMINGIRSELVSKEPQLKTILTGGVPSALLNYIDYDHYERDLQFDGLNSIYNDLKEID